MSQSREVKSESSAKRPSLLEIAKKLEEGYRVIGYIQLHLLRYLASRDVWCWYLEGEKADGSRYSSTYALCNINRKFKNRSDVKRAAGNPLLGKLKITVEGNFGFAKNTSQPPLIVAANDIFKIYESKTPFSAEEIQVFKDKYTLAPELVASAKEAYDAVFLTRERNESAEKMDCSEDKADNSKKRKLNTKKEGNAPKRLKVNGGKILPVSYAEEVKPSLFYKPSSPEEKLLNKLNPEPDAGDWDYEEMAIHFKHAAVAEKAADFYNKIMSRLIKKNPDGAIAKLFNDVFTLQVQDVLLPVFVHSNNKVHFYFQNSDGILLEWPMQDLFTFGMALFDGLFPLLKKHQGELLKTSSLNLIKV